MIAKLKMKWGHCPLYIIVCLLYKILYCIILYCTILYYIILYYIILYMFTLYCMFQSCF